MLACMHVLLLDNEFIVHVQLILLTYQVLGFTEVIARYEILVRAIFFEV